MYDKILPWWPGGPEWFLWISKMIALPVLLLHIAEAIMVDRTRLWKYGVQRGSKLWWKWMASTLIEGFGAFARIDATVKRKEVEAGNKKH